MTVYFIGAGPGDPDLITVKGAKLIKQADVIIYAGSLVNPEVLEGAKPEAEIHNSAYLNLPQVLDIIEKSYREGKMIARVHTGDPSIYGAIKEQMDALEEKQIPYEVVPGVSSFLAAAAALKKEFTLPGVSQSVILTRLEGRTPVPEKESLKSFAVHQTSMCIFLSVSMIEDVAKELVAGGYPDSTPIAVIQKASWEDQKIVQGTLADIGPKVKEAGIGKTAMIMVGKFLDSPYELSKLYDPSFTTEYRVGTRS